MRNFLFGILALFCLSLSAQLQHPSEFLPHELGETFTPHHLLVDYFEYVAETSPMVELEEYGRTNEGRPLLLAYISSPKNMARLDAIRQSNLRATGLLAGNVDPALRDIAIVWLSYSVHGNEAAGSEASMNVLHTLAGGARSRVQSPVKADAQSWLDNTVVIIDPSLNPDGYNRYTNWYRQMSGRFVDTNPNAREHQEPWPGGRVNHYLFDLNRDWAWQTQVESRQRMVKYHQWMPHIHADIHEQGYTSPYYFAPAAAPFHDYITDWQGDFQTEIGKNHAGYFDDQGWLYFTRERFDLLYPSYGDTYPTFNGSIGMTYEQGGHGRAGRGIDLPNGDTLTLMDRIEHHTTTSLSTIEIAHRESDRITENFRDYFNDGRSKPQGDYLTYIVPASTPPGKMRKLRQLLDRNGIEYSRATGTQRGKLYNYRTGRNEDAGTGAGDLIISAYQPRSVLTQVLFDPSTALQDSATYDITGWSVPLAYGLHAYASKTRFSGKSEPFPEETQTDPLAGKNIDDAYAFVIPWTALGAVAATAQLVNEGVRVRTAGNKATFGQQTFPAGSVFITRADNEQNKDYVEHVRRAVRDHGAQLHTVQTGFSTRGGDLGNGSYGLAGDVKVAILGGQGVSPNEFGQIWWYFDQEISYPASIFSPDDLGSVLTGDYDVLIMPDGRYDLKAQESDLAGWVRAGGKLVAIGAANGSLSKLESFGLDKKGERDEKGEADKKEGEEDPRLLPYGERERRFISTFNPGAVVEVELDDTHPLSFGIGNQYFSLKTGSDTYDYLDEGVNVGRVRTDPAISGFIGASAKADIEETLVFGVEEMGRGRVVYLVDNPLYRGFWEEGKLLFGNVVFQSY